MLNHRFVALSIVVVGMVGAREAAAGVWGNGPAGNGIQNNGIQNNGIQNNGIQNNGIQNNGIQNNGTQTSGVSYSGVFVDGTALSYIGQATSVFPYTCNHREDAQGAALNNCSACSKKVADADSYCKNVGWDWLCTQEAHQMCTLGAGTTMNATFTDGRTAKMRIESQAAGPSSFWNGSIYTNMSDVTYSKLSWVLDHAPNTTGAALLGGANSCTNQVCNIDGGLWGADPYCCANQWDSYCVQEANTVCGSQTATEPAWSTSGASVCGTTGSGTTATAVEAIFLSGVWDQGWGYASGGDKTASTTKFTIACRGIGAYAKAVDMGYKPWVSAAMDRLHRTAVRAIRADYCGDGNSFTTNGHPIDVEDYLSDTYVNTNPYDDIQFHTSQFMWEAAWDEDGANYINWYRSQSGTSYPVSAYDGTPVNQYAGSRSSYCYFEDPFAAQTNMHANGVQNLMVNLSQ